MYMCTKHIWAKRGIMDGGAQRYAFIWPIQTIESFLSTLKTSEISHKKSNTQSVLKNHNHWPTLLYIS